MRARAAVAGDDVAERSLRRAPARRCQAQLDRSRSRRCSAKRTPDRPAPRGRCAPACAPARSRSASCRRCAHCRSRQCCGRPRPTDARPRQYRRWSDPRMPAQTPRQPAAAWTAGTARLGAAGSRSLAAAPGVGGTRSRRSHDDRNGVGWRDGPADRFRRCSSAPVTTKAVDKTERAERRDQDDRHLLREIRDVRHHGARDDAGVGGSRRDAVARGRLAVFGEIGFEQVALRLGLALERAQLHVLIAGRGGLALELVEVRARAFQAARPRPWLRSPASAPAARLRRGSAGRGRRSAPASP